jgi:outer membrane beta-barrel protein
LVCPAVALAQIPELENPGTIQAVQERQYRMSHELAFGVGVLPLDAFYKGLLAQVSYTAHFSDHLAWQVGRGAYSYNVETGLRTQLVRDFSVNPTAFEEVQWMVGSDVIWSPFYGKTSFLNRSVSHFEIFFIAGGSVINLANSTGGPGLFRPAVNLGLGGRLFSTKHVSYRLDFANNVVVSKDKGIFQVPTIQLSAAINFGATE